MQIVKEGSTWSGIDREQFTVIHRVVVDGNTWIHYRNQRGQEFSCFEEAFVARFREDTNDKRNIS